ncbi:hypothetical protein Rhopal_001321-T1 [Rhodotorula paludigena]|uniref:Uncharacterized protein n=1 Tax=Rhodotorula paludigena TaxID=86838 RepID=A0AAV5G721_9BASI|nr:hypothetical protein Rhopal_001321-T1 [Rhodotorula paludigena]
MAASWQTTHLVEQLAYFKHKCAEQKKTLSRVGGELRKVKALKETSLSPRSATRNSTRSHSFRAGGSNPTNLPLAPPRLSLTPAQQRSTAARSRQGLEVIAEVSASGAISREVVQGGAEDSMKSRLAKFAYDPSRAGMHRSATSTPVQRPSTQPPVSSAHATNPFFYNPPPPRAAQLDGSTQSYGQSGFSNDEDDDPAALMPPPPVPQRPSQPIPQQQQQRSQSAFVSASTLRASAPTWAHLQQGTPARRPFSAARAAAGAGAVPFAPHDSPRSGSHPQPFRPASVAAMGAGAGGTAEWSGRGR